MILADFFHNGHIMGTTSTHTDNETAEHTTVACVPILILTSWSTVYCSYIERLVLPKNDGISGQALLLWSIELLIISNFKF